MTKLFSLIHPTHYCFCDMGKFCCKKRIIRKLKRCLSKLLSLVIRLLLPIMDWLLHIFTRNRTAEAEKILQKAVDSGLADGETYFNLAEFLYNRGEISKAFAYYDRSTELGHKLAPLRKADILKTR